MKVKLNEVKLQKIRLGYSVTTNELFTDRTRVLLNFTRTKS